MEIENEQKEQQLIREVAYPLYSNKGWVKFYGVVNIVVGVLGALSILGLIYAWLLIWIGVLIYGAAGKIERAYESGNKYTFIEAQRKLTTYFVINAVLVLVVIIFTVLVVSAFLGGAFTTFFNEMNYDPVF